MKREVADTIKWSLIDKVATQVLYAVTGIVLARMLSHDDFGLVGAILVFQAFANLFVDSGFSSALIQRKAPTRLDYSTVMWFNITMAVGIYAILFFCAPLIADWFQGDRRLIPLSRVMFLSFILSATAIVPTNRLMKQMQVRMIAVANSIGLTAGAIVGIWLAVAGYGAWAIVWQTIALSAVKSIVLWATTSWRPLWSFSWVALKSFFSVGMGVMGASLLNTVFLNIYSFFIGNRAGMASLGLYTQADKWSKMGIMSIGQSLVQAFLPPLSQLQDDRAEFARATAKMTRCAAYLTFPALGVLAVMAAPIFHLFFGTKWDASIVLFQILLLRGVFTVLSMVFNNYILALGKSRMLIISETLRDGVAIAAIIPTLGTLALTSGADITLGIRIFLWGQVAATAVGCIATMVIAARYTERSIWHMLWDLAPYIPLTLAALAAAHYLPLITSALFPSTGWLTHPAAILPQQLLAAAATYLSLNTLLGSQIQHQAIAYLRPHK